MFVKYFCKRQYILVAQFRFLILSLSALLFRLSDDFVRICLRRPVLMSSILILWHHEYCPISFDVYISHNSESTDLKQVYHGTLGWSKLGVSQMIHFSPGLVQSIKLCVPLAHKHKPFGIVYVGMYMPPRNLLSSPSPLQGNCPSAYLVDVSETQRL